MKVKLNNIKIKVKDGRFYNPAGDEITEAHQNYTIIRRHCMKQIGLKLTRWHLSGHDPIYAIGSYMIDGKVHPTPCYYYEAYLNLKQCAPKLAKKYWKALPPHIRVASLVQFWKDDIAEYGYEFLAERIKELAKSNNLFFVGHSKTRHADGIKTFVNISAMAGVIVENYALVYNGNNNWIEN